MILFIYFLIILIFFKDTVEFGYIPEWVGDLSCYGGLFVGLMGVLIIDWYGCNQENEPNDRT
ncbi:hypothetical protein ABT59_05890 [Enterococcus cecorum]|nr:hypothetical protein ABT60_10175 [Enterococcus cecorum]KLN93039.1 hypothetical protein ABT59_05890 [Enterococcus cecorum]CAI3431098.1 hypothetical protein CIRMBP1281_02003 [Enterococcus cecorum]